MGKTSPDHSGQISIDYSLTSFLFILFCVHSVFSFLWPLLQTLLLLYLFILFCFQSSFLRPLRPLSWQLLHFYTFYSILFPFNLILSPTLSMPTIFLNFLFFYFLFYFVSIQFYPFSVLSMPTILINFLFLKFLFYFVNVYIY